MKLGDWLEAEQIERIGFAREIEVSRQTLHRYITGDAIPRRETMIRIYVASRGNVGPPDFYDLPALDAPARLDAHGTEKEAA